MGGMNRILRIREYPCGSMRCTWRAARDLLVNAPANRPSLLRAPSNSASSFNFVVLARPRYEISGRRQAR